MSEWVREWLNCEWCWKSGYGDEGTTIAIILLFCSESAIFTLQQRNVFDYGLTDSVCTHSNGDLIYVFWVYSSTILKIRHDTNPNFLSFFQANKQSVSNCLSVCLPCLVDCIRKVSASFIKSLEFRKKEEKNENEQRPYQNRWINSSQLYYLMHVEDTLIYFRRRLYLSVFFAGRN